MNPIADGMKITMGMDFFAEGFTAEELEEVYYGLTSDPEQERLLCEAATFHEIDEHYNPGAEDMVLEAIRIKRFSQTESKMKALVRVFNKSSQGGITAMDPVIGKPRKSGLFATVTVQIPMSDGQVVSIIFHSPGGDERKIVADDTIIAFRWMLNKRDITHTVSPEKGKDVSLEKIGKRVMQVVAKNSELFQKKQAEVKAQKEELGAVHENITAQETRIQEMASQITELTGQGDRISDDIALVAGRLEKVRAKNADLEAKIEDLRAKRQEQVDKLTETEKNDEFLRIEKLGQEKVPGIGLGDAYLAGKMWEKYEQGLIPKAEWDEYAEGLYNSGKATRPASNDGETPKALAYIDTEEDQSVRDTLQIARGIISQGGWGLLLDTARDVAEPLQESMVLRLVNTLLGIGWAADENRWPMRKGNAQIIAFFEKPGALPDYQLIVDKQSKGYWKQTIDQDPADLAQALNDAAKGGETTLEETGVLPAKDQIDGYPAKRAAKLLHSLGKADAAMKDGFHVKLKNGEYLDLSIETHGSPDGADGGRMIYFTQYVEMGGDLVIDSEMVFLTNIYTGYLKLAEIGYRGPMGEVRRTRIGRAEKSWANTYSKNLIDQGYEKATEKSEEEEPEEKESGTDGHGITNLADLSLADLRSRYETTDSRDEQDRLLAEIERRVAEGESEEEPEAVTIANELLAGEYDDLPPGEIADMIEPIFDLPEEKYLELMEQVDAYATELTKKAAA